MQFLEACFVAVLIDSGIWRDFQNLSDPLDDAIVGDAVTP